MRSAGRIAAGSALFLKAQLEVCSDQAKEGDRFGAALQRDLEGSNGVRVPRGTIITFNVVHAKPAFEIAPEYFELDGSTYRVYASIDSVAFNRKGNSLLGALAGAAAGVAVTKAAGGNTKGAVAGGAIGAIAGAAVGDQLKKADGCIGKNSAIRLTLREYLALPRD